MVTASSPFRHRGNHIYCVCCTKGEPFFPVLQRFAGQRREEPLHSAPLACSGVTARETGTPVEGASPTDPRGERAMRGRERFRFVRLRGRGRPLARDAL